MSNKRIQYCEDMIDAIDLNDIETIRMALKAILYYITYVEKREG